MIFAAGLALVYMVWNLLIQSHFDKGIVEKNSQLSALATQSTTLQTQIAAATQLLMNDPNKLKKSQISELQSEIGTVEKKLHSASEQLIKADQLPQALQDVLQKATQLTLLEVKTLPARELKLAPMTDGALQLNNNPAALKEEAAGVYEHVVILSVSGNYFQIVKFLTALEQLPWRFYWQALDYKVAEYPDAVMQLRVYTLSSEEGLLGV
ncbi:MAG: MSHA biogenesis protein MshJ [Moraxellaceae bacterium]|nr:MAG: MSHA biogenesis protein MshJ [Moraxellaceae bacterium]